MSLQRHTFSAMGTDCGLVVTAAQSDTAMARRAIGAALTELSALERALSRFDASSGLSHLNAASGSWVEVDERLFHAVKAAVEAREITGGRFDPTILPALVAAGYDRTFTELEPRPARRAEGWRAGAGLFIDEDGSRARIDAGAAVDLGGIGKGFSAQRALEAMRRAWPELQGGLVDLGGDIAFFGAPPGAAAWRVAVADPRRPGETLTTLALRDAGVASSGRDRRRFGPERSLHHLIDPVTGAPAVAGPLAVTVVAPDATEAEVHGTTLAISTLDEARAHIEAHSGVSALYVPPRDRQCGSARCRSRCRSGSRSRPDGRRAPSARLDHRARGRHGRAGAADVLDLARPRDEHQDPGAPPPEGPARLAPDARLDRPLDARPPRGRAALRSGSPLRSPLRARALRCLLAARRQSRWA